MSVADPPHARWPHRVLGWVLLGCGCGGGLADLDSGADAGGTDTPSGPIATVLAEIDTHHFCDMVGLDQVFLRADAEACVVGDEGCDLPGTLEGTVFTCPAVDPTALLGVELFAPARYRIAADAHFTTGERALECFTLEGAEQFAVSQGQIDGSAQIHADDGHASCPEN